MAERKVSEWLHNVVGDEDNWNAGALSSHFTMERLRGLSLTFSSLEPTLRIKVLPSSVFI